MRQLLRYYGHGYGFEPGLTSGLTALFTSVVPAVGLMKWTKVVLEIWGTAEGHQKHPVSWTDDFDPSFSVSILTLKDRCNEKTAFTVLDSSVREEDLTTLMLVRSFNAYGA